MCPNLSNDCNTAHLASTFPHKSSYALLFMCDEETGKSIFVVELCSGQNWYNTSTREETENF